MPCPVLLSFSSIGGNIVLLVERSDEEYIFRLHRGRVYYVPQRVAAHAGNVSKKNLHGLGTCMGKFTKSGKFKLHVTALDVLAAHARYKVWLKPSAELSFLYGHHVLRVRSTSLLPSMPEAKCLGWCCASNRGNPGSPRRCCLLDE